MICSWGLKNVRRTPIPKSSFPWWLNEFWGGYLHHWVKSRCCIQAIDVKSFFLVSLSETSSLFVGEQREIWCDFSNWSFVRSVCFLIFFSLLSLLINSFLRFLRKHLLWIKTHIIFKIVVYLKEIIHISSLLILLLSVIRQFIFLCLHFLFRAL